ncbi:MAG TPA: ATP synthase F1 subunit delta [Saprospiraceae bacterium]|nr:ATP synthase F1 subunit delta [Saprospiraceae bacterium]
MSSKRIASRYAKSLIDLAVEQDKLPTILVDFEQLKEAFKNRDLYLMARSPIIKVDQKMDVFKALFAGKVDALTLTFIEVLTHKGRENILPEVVKEFFNQYNKKMGILSVKMTTAVPADEAILASAKAKILSSGISATQVDIRNIVNPDILGGFQLEYDGKVYDASVATHLRNLKQNLRK